MERTITVEGRGACERAPDAVVFECSMNGRFATHAEALKASAECAGPLRDALASAGLPADSLKTASVSVRPYYENSHRDDVYTTVFAGFEYDHRLRLETSSDNAAVGAVMDAMVGTGVQFSMSYCLRDQSSAEREARESAVADAKEKAAQLAAAAGVKLGAVVSVVYGSGDAPATYRTMSLRANAPDIVPENIRVSDSVTVSWEIL